MTLAAIANGWAVAPLRHRIGICSKVFHQLRIIDVIGKGVDNGVKIDFMAVCSELHAASEPPLKVRDKFGCRTGVAGANEPARNQLRIGIDGDPDPGVAYDALFGYLFGDVLFFAADEAPDLVALNPLALQVAEHVVLVSIASGTDFNQETRYRALLTAQHAADRANRVALNQGGKDLGAFIDAQAVHINSIRDRSRIVNRKTCL